MSFLSKCTLAATLGMAAVPALAETGQSIQVEQPWAPATPGGARTAAVYATLKNPTSAADRLLGGVTPVARQVQIHEMSMANGVMRMRELAGGLNVPAKGSVALAPDGGYHIMLVGLKSRLKAGESFPLTLRFQAAGAIALTVSVQTIGATHPAAAAKMNSGAMNMK